MNITQRVKNVPPISGAIVLAFLISLLNWGFDSIPSSIPGEVTLTGYIVAAGGLSWLVGYITSRFTRSEFGRPFGDPNDGGDQVMFSQEKGTVTLRDILLLMALIAIVLLLIVVF